MENFDDELFEVDEQIRALEEYDSSNDEADEEQQFKYEEFDDIVTFNVTSVAAQPPPAKISRPSNSMIKLEVKVDPDGRGLMPAHPGPATLVTGIIPETAQTSSQDGNTFSVATVAMPVVAKKTVAAPKKIVKRRGHLDPEDVEALEQERGFRMEARGHKGRKKVYNYICLTCGHQCKHLSGATDHVNVQHRKIPLECTECDYVTFRWKNISHHRLKFHKLKGMSCPVDGCNFTGVVVWQMRQHMEAKHPEEDASAEFPAEAMTEDGQPVPSGVVGQRNDWSRQHGFQMVNSRKTGGYLTQYYEITHDPVTKKRHYHCTLCDHNHKSAANLLNHINAQHLKQQWKCVWCEFTTMNSNTLNDHSSKKHQYQKKQCIVPGCTYKTIQEETYQMHLAMKHNAVYDESDHSIKIFKEIPPDEQLQQQDEQQLQLGQPQAVASQTTEPGDVLASTSTTIIITDATA